MTLHGNARRGLRSQRGLFAAILAVSLPTLILAKDAASVMGAASKAMGADTLSTIQYSGSGYDFFMGQAYSPTSAWPKFIVKNYIRSIDFRIPSSRDDRLRLQFENPPRGGGQQPILGERKQNQTIVVSANTPWIQQLEIWMTPHGFLKAASERHPTLKLKKVAGKEYSVLTFLGQNHAPVNGYINDQNMVERVETWMDNPVLGDMLLSAVYSDYKDFGGVKFPTHVIQWQGEFPILDVTITDVKVNPLVTIEEPRVAAAPVVVRAPGQRLPTEKLADGVYLISDAAAVSLAFDFKDYSIVLEGPASEERAKAVIAETKLLIPGKPIRYVINTHQHFDHAGGLRAFVTEGITIVTQAINKPYYEKVLALPHTLNPELSLKERGKQKVKVEVVEDKKVMTDGDHTVELYHLQGNMHNAGLLIAYLPKEKILIEADVFNPPADPNARLPLPLSPYTENFLANLDRLKLDVGRIIPIHYPADGRKILPADMTKAAGR